MIDSACSGWTAVLYCVKFVHMRSPLLFEVDRILILVFIVYRLTEDLSVEKGTK